MIRYSKHKKTIRLKILKSQKYKCALCGAKLDQENATIDHVKPATGLSDWDFNFVEGENSNNFIVVHKECNQLKADMPLEVFENFLEEKLKERFFPVPLKKKYTKIWKRVQFLRSKFKI